jgi:hypothetical protein
MARLTLSASISFGATSCARPMPTSWSGEKTRSPIPRSAKARLLH